MNFNYLNMFKEKKRVINELNSTSADGQKWELYNRLVGGFMKVTH